MPNGVDADVVATGLSPNVTGRGLALSRGCRRLRFGVGVQSRLRVRRLGELVGTPTSAGL